MASNFFKRPQFDFLPLTEMHGGDMLVADHRFRGHSKESDRPLFPRSIGTNSLSFSMALSMRLNLALAANILHIGSFFSGGIVQTVILMAAGLGFAALSLQLSLETWVFGSTFTYAGTWTILFGRRFAFVPHVLVILFLIEHPIALASGIPTTVQTIFSHNWPDAPAILLDAWFLTYVPLFLAVIPALLSRSIVGIRWISLVGNISLLVLIVCLLVDGFSNKTTFQAGPSPRLFGGDVQQIGHVLIFVDSCSIFNPLLHLILQELERPTYRRASYLTFCDTAMKMAVFVLIGVLNTWTYYRWVDFTETSVLDFMDQTRPLTIVARVSTLVNRIFTYASYMYLLSRTLTAIFANNNGASLFVEFFSGVIVTLFSIAFVFVTKSVLEVAKIVFSLAQTALIYILPAVFYLGLYRFRSRGWGAVAVFLLVAGAFTGSVEMYDGILRCKEAFN
jgi:hypothetical protein